MTDSRHQRRVIASYFEEAAKALRNNDLTALDGVIRRYTQWQEENDYPIIVRNITWTNLKPPSSP